MSKVHLDIWYGDNQTIANNGLCQRWVNIPGRVSPKDQVAVLQYQLNDGEWQPLSMGPDYRRLTGHGDFNIELGYHELSMGENIVKISSSTTDGQRIDKVIRLNNDGKSAFSLPQTIHWTEIDHIQKQAQVVDGLWRVDNGRVWTTESGYDRAIAVGSIDLQSYEIRVPITIYGFSSGGSAPMSGGYGVGIALHWQGHVDWGADEFASGQPRHGYEPIGAMLWYGWDRQFGFRLRLEGHDASTPLGLDHSGFQMVFGEDYMLCFRVRNRINQPCQYGLKGWSIEEPEPDHWMIETEGSIGELKTGSALLLAHHTVCSFGNVLITPL